jgi:hypothetical protein
MLSFPPNPSPGEVFAEWTYDAPNSRWLVTGDGGGAGVHVGPTEPPNPSEGNLWLNSDDDTLSVFDGTTWITVSGTAEASLSSFAPTTAAFVVPPVGGTVDIELEQAEWCDIGAVVFSGGMTAVITAVTGNTITVERLPGPEIEAPSLIARRLSPVMLAAAAPGGAPILVGGPPQLTRVGDMVTWNFQGNNGATQRANTVSLAWVPEGFRPTGNVTQAIQAPAGNITCQIYTTGTVFFPDGGAAAGRWTIRFSANFAANAPMSANISWATTDPMP